MYVFIYTLICICRYVCVCVFVHAPRQAAKPAVRVDFCRSPNQECTRSPSLSACQPGNSLLALHLFCLLLLKATTKLSAPRRTQLRLGLQRTACRYFVFILLIEFPSVRRSLSYVCLCVRECVYGYMTVYEYLYGYA